MRRFLADFVHNCVAHPLLFLTRSAWWAVWLHDKTAEIAYVRSLILNREVSNMAEHASTICYPLHYLPGTEVGQDEVSGKTIVVACNDCAAPMMPPECVAKSLSGEKSIGMLVCAKCSIVPAKEEEIVQARKAAIADGTWPYA